MGCGFDSWSGKTPHAVGQLSLCAGTAETRSLEPALYHKSGPRSEKPTTMMKSSPRSPQPEKVHVQQTFCEAPDSS